MQAKEDFKKMMEEAKFNPRYVEIHGGVFLLRSVLVRHKGSLQYLWKMKDEFMFCVEVLKALLCCFFIAQISHELFEDLLYIWVSMYFEVPSFSEILKSMLVVKLNCLWVFGHEKLSYMIISFYL